jgi:Putative addiction module component
MKLTLPLDKMTTEEKLLALEEIWEDLCRIPDNIPSPAWHGSVLEERQQRVEEGSSAFVEWTRAKQNIRDATQ